MSPDFHVQAEWRFVLVSEDRRVGSQGCSVQHYTYTGEYVVPSLNVGSHSRYTPSIHDPSRSRLLWVVPNVWAEAINCTSKVMIRTPHEIPVLHKWLEGFVDYGEAAVEQSTAEVSKHLFINVPSST